MKKILKDQIEQDLDDVIGQVRVVLTDYICELDLENTIEQDNAMDYIVEELKKSL